MADSDNSRTLTAITRRKLLSAAGFTLLSPITPSAETTSTPRMPGINQDDAVIAWRRWEIAHGRRVELGRYQQRLEVELMQSLRHRPGAQRDAIDQEVGYSRAYEAESEAADIEQAMARTLWETPAVSMAGTIAKLHSLIEMEDPGGSLRETPWPELRMVLADLLSISDAVPRALDVS
ncbi:MAG: hypothetical protein PW844_15515 [Pantoea sp.]|uniref:hypothetical protein n=1 Tax=Pantoea sp. TaxID=69393 RepID=UPI00238E4EEB|nr:hypothetical protein [Pantoea sp.]MDE1187870.1 hypothetical protein [Pantoea sp.]